MSFNTHITFSKNIPHSLNTIIWTILFQKDSNHNVKKWKTLM